MRLIDADALEQSGIPFATHGGGCFIALGSLRTAPTIDAVPVVRCKDCKHWDYWRDGPNGVRLGNCKLEESDGMVVARWEFNYCWYGERKDGVEDGK